MSRVIIEIGKKRYQPYRCTKCSKKSCALWSEKCEEVEYWDHLPCEKISNILHKAGLADGFGVNYKEVR